MKTYPSKELCLQLARYYCEVVKDEQLMWTWLITWGFYDMYLEGYMK
jgi:hypothetical protein